MDDQINKIRDEISHYWAENKTNGEIGKILMRKYPIELLTKPEILGLVGKRNLNV